MPKKKQRRKTSRPRPKRAAREARRARPKPGTIEFCEKCGSIMIPVKGRSDSTYLRCRGCGAEKRKSVRALRIVEEKGRRSDVAVLEKDIPPLPMTEAECPKCSHRKAYWWMQQTRAADEPPTQFFRCDKCKHVWREYK